MDVLELLKEEMETDNLMQKLKCLQKVKVVAAYLKKARCGNELLPYLFDLQQKEHDCEFLRSMAIVWLELLDYIEKEVHLLHLIQPLLDLLQLEETIIRDEALDSLMIILEKSSNSQRREIEEICLLPLFESLCNDSNFLNRISAVALLLLLFPRFTPSSHILQPMAIFRKISTFCNDSNSIVQRFAVQTLRKFFSLAEKDDILSYGLSICKSLWIDNSNMESLQPEILQAILSLATKCTPNENLVATLPFFIEACSRKNWIMKQCLLKIFREFVSIYRDSLIWPSLIPIFENFVAHGDDEIRKLAAISMVEFNTTLSELETSKHFISLLETLSTDSVASVRASVCTPLLLFASGIGAENSERYLLHIIHMLLEDYDPSVRLSVALHVGELIEALAVKTVDDALFTSALDLLFDSQWRIRLALINSIPAILRSFEKTILNEALEKLLSAALVDEVHSVRRAVVGHIGRIAEYFGNEETELRLWPLLERIYKFDRMKRTDFHADVSTAPAYLIKINILHAIKEIAKIVTSSKLTALILPLLLNAIHDEIANVRFVAIQIITFIHEQNLLPENIYASCIEPELLLLLKDPDKDVVYYARKGMRL